MERNERGHWLPGRSANPGGRVAVLLRLNWIAAKARADLLTHCHTEIIAGRLKLLPPCARSWS